MSPTLLVLAAGMSSRYGGLSKQTDSMGPHGETLLDYSVFDAKRAGFGRVVFISSSSAFQPLPFLATYAASNAALLSMSEAWAAELTGTGVRLLVACPGGMQTNFQRSAGVKTLPSERLMAPEEVADRLVRALPPGPTTVIISTRSLAMSLLARVLPRAATVALWKNLMSRLR